MMHLESTIPIHLTGRVPPDDVRAHVLVGNGRREVLGAPGALAARGELRLHSSGATPGSAAGCQVESRSDSRFNRVGAIDSKPKFQSGNLVNSLLM